MLSGNGQVGPYLYRREGRHPLLLSVWRVCMFIPLGLCPRDHADDANAALLIGVGDIPC